MNVVCLIPARYESSRFAGKPLALLQGKPIIQHVYERALSSGVLTMVAIVTDDDRIYSAAQGFGGRAVMTAAFHRSGTDRIAEAADILRLAADDIVINIQGDQPLFNPVQIGEVADPLKEDPTLNMTTLIYPITREEEITSPHIVKTVFDENHFALYFSRSTIPFVRDFGKKVTYYKHHGIYGYRRSFLATFAQLREGTLEDLEALEQLRVLEHGYKIKVIVSAFDSLEIDTPQDLERAAAILAQGEGHLCK